MYTRLLFFHSCKIRRPGDEAKLHSWHDSSAVWATTINCCCSLSKMWLASLWVLSLKMLLMFSSLLRLLLNIWVERNIQQYQLWHLYLQRFELKLNSPQMTHQLFVKLRRYLLLIHVCTLDIRTGRWMKCWTLPHFWIQGSKCLLTLVIDILDYVNGIGNRRRMLNHAVHSYASHLQCMLDWLVPLWRFLTWPWQKKLSSKELF